MAPYGLYTLTAPDVANVCGVHQNTAYKRCAAAPSIRRDWNTLYYRPADLIPVLRARRGGVSAEQIAGLLDLDAERRAEQGLYARGDLYVGDQDAAALVEVLTPLELERLELVKRRLRAGALGAFWTRAMSIPSSVWSFAVLHPCVLRYVLTGSEDELPATASGWANFSASFALLHMDAPTVLMTEEPRPTIHFTAPLEAA